ncbi:NAD-dependent protein deacylase [Lysinibacillus sp. 2017]|uniref:SIR2 family NAD-dependent protein deacylase n=1 Tax=unclassified Lysinibacillus TaxID=2636778 RepID=UPI000D528B46|nr:MULTISPECIES: NAD-dependent deacylase [unclassified Lysinibacillus]AWE07572.1 NAD-dependent protein deacylase [Lysinibacillus sp. 2017]TGN36736.1 NAD-dependent deacylase [Lysinibacillus sp. S2017]
MAIFTLVDWIKQSTSTVVLTGAGMSTESGIPDFRSQSGLWQTIDPRTVASVESLENDYEVFRNFYKMRLEALLNCFPHQGHVILADWERRGLVSLVATQNVDQFHQVAGSEEVAELHGNIVTFRCNDCNKPHTKEQFMNDSVCVYCLGKLRPNVVLFGEALPQEAWNQALNEIQNADLVIVIGTSLEVYPVNQLPKMARGKLVYINLDITGNNRQFDLVIEGTAGDVLAEINEALVENEGN